MEGQQRYGERGARGIAAAPGILEQKGYVRHREEGRAFRYYPAIDRSKVSSGATHQLVRRFFGGSPGALALSLLKSESLTQQELDSIRALIEREAPRE